MAHIRKRGNRFAVSWREPGGRQRTRTCPDAATARALAREVEQALALGRSWEPRGPGPQPTALRTIAEAWLTEESQRLAPATLRRYAEALDLWLAWVRVAKLPEDVSSLSRATLSDLRTWLATAPGRHGKLRRPTTADRLVQPVELCWTWAAESERWPDVPSPRRLRRLRSTPAPVRAPSWEQAAAMYGELQRAAGQYTERTPAGVAPGWVLRLVALAWYTGGRRDELLRARWERWDGVAGLLELPAEDTKGGYGGRVVPVCEELAHLLWEWQYHDQQAGRGDGWIVASPTAERDGRGHADRLVRRAWRRAGVPQELWHGRPLHALRRRVRTHLVTVGTHGDVIDALLGHAAHGSGGRHYTARDELLPAMRRAVQSIPTIVRAAVTGGAGGEV